MRPSAHRLAAFPLLAIPLVSACTDRPAVLPEETPSAPSSLLAALTCTADASAETLTCGSEAGGAGRARPVIVGGQNQFVRLTSSGTAYDAGTGVLSSNVSVQNLLLAAMGSTDGATADGEGVRVFFAAGPTSGVIVANADGTGTFLGSGQPFFRYLAEVGGGILAPGQTSAAKTWRFAMNGASSFTFTVYVQASTPAGAAFTTHLTRVTAGDIHTCALSADALVYCWGSDFSGQRGNGSGTSAPAVPSQVPMPGGALVAELSSGLHFSCALTTGAKVYCWGYAPGYTHLGSPGGYQVSPTELDLPPGVVLATISGGVNHACGLTAEGQAYCWGGDGVGQLGNGPALTAEQDTATAVVMPAGVRFVSITAGASHTCAIGDNARAYCWGYADAGQAGVGARIYSLDAPALVVLPEFEVGFASISAATYHTCAIMLSGKAYCWGNDYVGELGNGGATSAVQYAPSAVDGGHTFTAISAGLGTTCALGTDGASYCWGDARYGGLGNGTTTGSQPSPAAVLTPAGVSFTGIVASGLHTCAVSAGPAYCWGLNFRGAIGDAAEANRDRPVVVAGTR